MRGLVHHGVRDVRCEQIAEPQILDPGDALVAVERAAICGSDLHVYEGREHPDVGTVVGHEFVGTVLEVGREVHAVKRGDRVASPFTTSCGRCRFCAMGLTARCERGQLFGWIEAGAGLHGGQAECVRVPLADTTLRAVPEDVSLEEALLLGDTLATGWHCARMADIAPGSTCVVLGCGAVGLMAVVAARELGAQRVFAVDRMADRLALAARFGAEPLDLGSEDPFAALNEQTRGGGADAVLEAAGTAEATRLAYAMVRPGGVIAAVGVHHERELAISPGQMYDKNLTYRAGRCPARHIMDELVPVVLAHRYDLSAVFTHRWSLARGPEAYALFADHREACIKVVLDPNAKQDAGPVGAARDSNSP